MKLVNKTPEELEQLAKDNNLPGFVIRIKAEADELEVKMDKLKAFMDTNRYLTLSLAERDLLTQQYKAMAEYYGILYERFSIYYSGVNS